MANPLYKCTTGFGSRFSFTKIGSSLFVAAFFVVEIEGLAFEQSENPDVVRHISIPDIIAISPSPNILKTDGLDAERQNPSVENLCTVQTLFRLGAPVVQMHNRFRLPFLFHKKGISLFVAAFFVVEIEGLEPATSAM